MRNLILTLIVIMNCSEMFAENFTSLSKETPVVLLYSTSEKSYVDVILNIDFSKTEQNSVAVKLSFNLGNSTFNEYAVVTANSSGFVKRILLNEGEELKAELFLNEADVSVLNLISGSINLSPPKSGSVPTTVSSNKFVSDIWADTQLPLFRVVKEDETPQTFSVKFNFTDQFEFDKMFYKVKMISPTDGIVIYEESLDVNLDETVNRTAKSFEVELPEFPVASKGTFYFQIQLNMMETRVNGVKSVEYELSDQ